MLSKATGLTKVLKKIATTEVVKVTTKPRERRRYGQISQGYAVWKGVLSSQSAWSRDEVIRLGDSHRDIVASEEDEKKRDDGDPCCIGASHCECA